MSFLDHDPPCSVCGREHYPWCKPGKTTFPVRRGRWSTTKPAIQNIPRTNFLVQARTSPSMDISSVRGTLGDFLDATVGDKHGIFDEPLEVDDGFE